MLAVRRGGLSDSGNFSRYSTTRSFFPFALLFPFVQLGRTLRLLRSDVVGVSLNFATLRKQRHRKKLRYYAGASRELRNKCFVNQKIDYRVMRRTHRRRVLLRLVMNAALCVTSSITISLMTSRIKVPFNNPALLPPVFALFFSLVFVRIRGIYRKSRNGVRSCARGSQEIIIVWNSRLRFRQPVLLPLFPPLVGGCDVIGVPGDNLYALRLPPSLSCTFVAHPPVLHAIFWGNGVICDRIFLHFAYVLNSRSADRFVGGPWISWCLLI